MRKLIYCLIIFSLAVVSSAGEPEPEAPPQKDRCPVCGMFVSMFADWNAKVEFADSTHAIFDGPKCMFKYYLDIKKYSPAKNREDIKAVLVKDYYSEADIDARKASYVIWSDVYGPMGHEPIPFEKEPDAKKFLKDHKGRKILRFGDISLRLIKSLDNP